MRNAVARPGTTLVIVGMLALAIGATTLLFSFLDALFLRSLPVAEPDRLVRLFGGQELDRDTAGVDAHLPVSHPNFEDLRDRSETLSDLVAYGFVSSGLLGGEEPMQVIADIVSPRYFDVLGVSPVLGRVFDPDEDAAGAHPVDMLSHRLWRRAFGGDESVVGRTIVLKGRQYTVIGVAPPGFQGVDLLFGADLWVPMAMYEHLAPATWAQFLDHRRGLLFHAVGRLAPGASLRSAQEEMDALARRLALEHPRWNDGWKVSLMPLPSAAVDPNRRASLVRSAWVMMGSAAVVLLIACANVANLLMARALERRREIAVRHSLGAGRRHLVRQLLAESLVLATVAGALGIALAVAGHQLFWNLRPTFMDRMVVVPELRPGVLAFSVAITLLTGALFGLAPVWSARKVDLVLALKNGGEAAGFVRSRWWEGRDLLVVAQISLSLVALIGAGLFLRSFANALEIEPGFATSNMVLATLDPAVSGYQGTRAESYLRQAVEAVEALPGVRAAALASASPLGEILMRRVVSETSDRAPEEGHLIGTRVVGDRYFETVGMPILSGRAFDERDREGGLPVAVVNESLASAFWPRGGAVGRGLRLSGEEKTLRVVGVVADAKYQDLDEEGRDFIYRPLRQGDAMSMILHTSTDGPSKSYVETVRRRLHEVDPRVPVQELQTVESALEEGLWGPRVAALLLSAFSTLALLLSCAGLYGVLSHAVASRRRELGVRLALGARRGQMVGLVVVRALALISLGIVIGLLLAAGAIRGLQGLLYGIEPYDPVAFVVAPAVLLVIGLVAVVPPIVRGTRVDLTTAMRVG